MEDQNKKEYTSASGNISSVSRKKFLTLLGIGGMALFPSFGLIQCERSDDIVSSGGQGRFNIKDYGAAGDNKTDDSEAFQDAIDAIAEEGQGALYIPAGDYRIDKQITKNIQRWDLSIVGDGQGVSSLYCTNDDGVFKFLQRSRTSQVTIRDLSFFADGQGRGTAIDILQPEGGNRHHRNLVIQNVELRGVDIERDYFNYGIKTLAWRPLFSNVIFAGPYGPGVDKEDPNSVQYAAACGIQVDGSYKPIFKDCNIWSAYKGISILSDTRPGPEGGRIGSCTVVGCRIGIDVNTGGVEPGLVIDGSHVNCRDVGIRLRRKYFSITNCLLYGSAVLDSDTVLPYTDIELTDAVGGIITDNIFHQPNNNRTNIDIKGSSKKIQIKDNLFNSTGGTPVRTASTAEEIIVVNNQYTDQVNQSANVPLSPSDVLTPNVSADSRL